MFPVSGAAQLVACSMSIPSQTAFLHCKTYLTSRPALAQILSHKAILQIAKPSTLLEMCLGQKHIPKPQLLRLALELLDDRGMRREALLGRIANLAEVDGIGGYAFFFDEFLDL